MPALLSAASDPALHPKHPKLGPVDGGIKRSRKAQSQHSTGVGWINDSVVPQTRTGVISMGLTFKLINHWLFKLGGLFRSPGLALTSQTIFTDLSQDTSGLLATHSRNFCVRPHPEKTGPVGATAHAIVASTVAATNDHGELGHLRA